MWPGTCGRLASRIRWNDPSMMIHAKFDVVVVGAGISGLCCARELLRSRPGLRVAVVEARDRIGGERRISL